MSEEETKEKIMTGPKAAAFLGITPPTLRRYVQKGLIPAIHWSAKKVFYRESDLNEFAKTGKVKARPQDAVQGDTAGNGNDDTA